jgi:hypothetical protein
MFQAYHFGGQIKDDDICETCSTHGEINAYILARKPHGKRPFRRAVYKCKEDVQTNRREMSLKMSTGFTWLRTGTNG